jgi:hypothetical protein
VSDRGRPTFLPPEDPEPSDPPLLPGLEGSATPAGPARDRRTLVIALATLMSILLVGTLAFLRSGGSGPSPARALPSVEYVAVPDPCTAVEPALPADVRPLKPRRFQDLCTWELLRPDRSRSLEVEFRLEKTAASGSSGTVKAAKEFSDDLGYASDSGRNGGYENDPERLDGLGDEAFAARASNVIVSGPTEKSAKSYDMGGALVEVRRRNVVLTVRWRGADYPSGAREHKKLVGRRLAYPDARLQALSVVTAAMGRLH